MQEYNQYNESINEDSEKEINQEMEKLDEEEVIKFSSSSIPYPAKVEFSKEQFSLFEINRAINEFKEINLNPEFQRNKGLWDRKKQSRLIESILMGIPLPLFYFAENKGGGLSVVDGLQRLHTITEYFKNEFKLQDLTYIDGVKGKLFKDLQRDNQARIERYQIQVYVMSADTPETVKLDIFERINSGGTPLNKQEMRHALYKGKSTKLLKELAECDEFKKAVTLKLDSKRMRDRYVILRALAFYLAYNVQLIKKIPANIDPEINGSFDNFLGKYMRIMNSMDENECSKLEYTFKTSMQLLYNIYKDNTFKRNSTSNTFNMIMFESLFFITASLQNQIKIDLDTWHKELDNIINKSWFQSTLDNSSNSIKRMKEHFIKLSDNIEELRTKYA